MKRKLALFILFLFVMTPVTAFAQETDQPSDVLGISITPSPTPTPVDYLLPYPGLLPDSPLYKLKVFRDKIVGFLIADPLKKAEFDLLEADKRLNGAYYLSQKSPQKTSLIGETVSKGENYFAEGIEQISLSKKQGLDVTDITHKFFTSSQKHLEVITTMEQSTSPSLKQVLSQEEKRVVEFEKEVNPTNLKK